MEKYATDYFSTILLYLRKAFINEAKHKSYKSAWQQLKNIRTHKQIIEILKKEQITLSTIKEQKIQKTILWLLLRF